MQPARIWLRVAKQAVGSIEDAGGAVPVEWLRIFRDLSCLIGAKRLDQGFEKCGLKGLARGQDDAARRHQ